ncbi:MAG: LEPR-XLL domain-containing protein, partial [Alphaproteobacteria bacterium]|nr:LEPR-XLL domain-containing protein [Alphaproteobacteria bacterium]
MMRNRSWLAGLASKIFPRRFAAAKRAARRRPQNSLRSFSDAPLASETLEPRYLLSGLSLVSVAMIDQGNETDGSPTIFEFTRSQETSSELSANILLQGTAQANVDYTAPVELGANNTLSVTFAAGSNTAQINLPTLADSVMDAGETILAIVQPGSGYALSPGGDRATAIIE